MVNISTKDKIKKITPLISVQNFVTVILNTPFILLMSGVMFDELEKVKHNHLMLSLAKTKHMFDI